MPLSKPVGASILRGAAGGRSPNSLKPQPMNLKSSVSCAAVLLGLTAYASAQVAPSAGDIAITEIMFNPGAEACVTDANGEYFEVLNISSKALDLNGIYFEDRNTTTGNPSGVGFQVLGSVAVLPTLYPGQYFLFARSGNTSLNGGLPTPHYVYAATTAAAPVDKSQVGSGAMFLNNSNQDGLFVSTGNFPSMGGIIIEAVVYNASQAPLTPNAGISAERVDPFQPWTSTATSNTNSAQPGVAAAFGPCIQRGTPGAVNNTSSVINWPTNSTYDSVFFPNSGVLNAPNPVSVGVGSVILKAAGGLNLAGQVFTFGYADNNPFEAPLAVFIPGNPGSIVIDLATAGFLDDPSYLFDANGDSTFAVAVPNNPLLVNMQFQLQWLSFDPVNFILVGSNGKLVTVTE